jgi:hypothetical protein
MEDFKKPYYELQKRILAALRELIKNSKIGSKHVQEKAIKVNLFDYVELTLVNDRLTFIDSKGLHHSLFSEANLTDLLDIISEHPCK